MTEEKDSPYSEFVRLLVRRLDQITAEDRLIQPAELELLKQFVLIESERIHGTSDCDSTPEV